MLITEEVIERVKVISVDEDNKEGCVREFLRICKEIRLSFDYV